MRTITKSTKTLLSLVLAVAAICGAYFAHAQEDATQTQKTEDSIPELILRVKPSLCLRYSADEDCKLSVEIVWRDSTPNSYCLHSVQDQDPVQCWTQKEGATLEEDREINEDLVYWLTRPGEASKLVTATVEMATVVNDEKRSRSRRRHVWNLI